MVKGTDVDDTSPRVYELSISYTQTIDLQHTLKGANILDFLLAGTT